MKIEQYLQFSDNRTPRSDDLFSLKNTRILTRELLVRRSLNTQPLRELLQKHIDEDKVRASKTRYGLMTALLPEFKPQPKWIEEIPKGQLIDYIMASARLPGLAPVKIDGHRMIDGGVIEVVPLSMLRGQGIRRLVVVDMVTHAVLRSPFLDNVEITYIHDPQNLGKILDVTPERLLHNRTLGYLDTLKAFGRLKGEYFSFEPAEYRLLLQRFGPADLAGLEQAALVYEMDRCRVFTASAFIEAVRQKCRETQAIYLQQREELQIEHKLSAIASGRLHMLSLLPPMRLAFLLEVNAQGHEGGLARLPARFFHNLDQAVQALSTLTGDDPAKDI
jgi:NTE family protein